MYKYVYNHHQDLHFWAHYVIESSAEEGNTDALRANGLKRYDGGSGGDDDKDKSFLRVFLVFCSFPDFQSVYNIHNTLLPSSFTPTIQSI